MASFKVGDRVEVVGVGRGTLVEIRPDRGQSTCDHEIRLDLNQELKSVPGRVILTDIYLCFKHNLRKLTDLERLADETKEEV
jgi:hypothetical protein